jgi:hypothetical protein
MSRIALLAAGLVAALALAAPIGATSTVTKLTGTVGPGFTITLKKGTAKVKTLKAGSYKITVNDKSTIHDFHLTGPGVNKRERTGARPRVTRDRHPAAFSSPKAVRRSRDRGCKGHRILRRVPADRRHSGSSRGVGFHETASTVVLAVFRILRPIRNPPKEGRTARLQHTRKRSEA